MKALILVDIQNDFLPNGSLAVPQGDQIFPVVNQLLKCAFDLKIATKDWHPKNHISFAANHSKQPGETVLVDGFEQILWPVHCVKETWGAEFATGWDSHLVDKVIYKGTDPSIDSYSTFFDNEHVQETPLKAYLREYQVEEVYLAGLATEYCVKYSALDSLGLGFRTFVVIDGCRGVNLNADDTDHAIHELLQAGAEILSLADVQAKLNRPL